MRRIIMFLQPPEWVIGVAYIIQVRSVRIKHIDEVHKQRIKLKEVKPEFDLFAPPAGLEPATL